MDDGLKKSSEFQPIIHQHSSEIGKAVGDLGLLIGQAISQLHAWWIENRQAIVDGFRKMVEQFPPAYRQAMIVLAQHGWYVDKKMGFGEPFRFAEALSNPDQVDCIKSELKSFFASRLDAIEVEVCRAFPHRTRILSQAFIAHRAGQYACSIPVLLAQVDGICYETVRAYYFMSEGRGSSRPGTAAHATAVERDSWSQIVLAPLSEYGELNANRRRRAADSRGLNRHAVMHGESLDYDSEENSLKAISLLSYVSDVLTRKPFGDRLIEQIKADSGPSAGPV